MKKEKKEKKQQYAEQQFNRQMNKITDKLHELFHEFPEIDFDTKLMASKFLLSKIALLGSTSYYEALGLLEESKSDIRDFYFEAASRVEEEEENLENYITNYKGPMAEA